MKKVSISVKLLKNTKMHAETPEYKLITVTEFNSTVIYTI